MSCRDRGVNTIRHVTDRAVAAGNGWTKSAFAMLVCAIGRRRTVDERAGPPIATLCATRQLRLRRPAGDEMISCAMRGRDCNRRDVALRQARAERARCFAAQRGGLSSPGRPVGLKQLSHCRLFLGRASCGLRPIAGAGRRRARSSGRSSPASARMAITARATSSGRCRAPAAPRRLGGRIAASVWRALGSAGPGPMPFTRMRGASASAMVCVSAHSAALRRPCRRRNAGSATRRAGRAC